ncbi:asparagine synthase [Methylobacillus sp. MM3]|uniref:asparagine synthetase B family protein n=1 Tax=Methylobacillus sp. MM3 TaxID=1848039 RepID=UPI0007E0514C|nr:asparagine synthase C-terminal domain-containing protein [Methylobacillus sp. MM3]OAJ69557.1 asparagine synthase [Methylobacillus sp. MM3]
MGKLWGWLGGHAVETRNDRDLLAAMGFAGPAATLLHGGCALASDKQAGVAEENGLCIALVGRPRMEGVSSSISPAQQVLALWRQHGREALQKMHGPFALAVVDTQANTALLAIDRVGVHSLAFASVGGKALVFASRVDAVAAHPAVGKRLSIQALFNYFYFHDIPAPGTIYEGVEKLLPGQYVWFADGRLERDYYWHLDYRDASRSDFAGMSAQFRSILRESVARAADGDDPAAFLSGGTDSSTVAGVLTELRGKPARTYSIGFSAEGFDEMGYARIAASHFGLDMREYYLKPEDILRAIPVIAQHYDEPFANESAVPTWFCARMAQADGFRVMLAGDGGDELFGGNVRYAKQKMFEAYHALPSFLRGGLIEPFAALPGLDRFPPTRKLQSYLRQANIPLPERMESYNYLYRQPLDGMFAADFLAEVDAGLPAAWLRDAYDRTQSDSYINRMMHLDLKFTLADNDLRKVNGMTEAAGIEVRYPLLDDALMAFSGEVPPDWKVRGHTLRWFFKNALKGYLPDEIIRKRKHGFGLPFGVWARDYAPLRERIEDRLSDFRKRGWLQPTYIDHIRAEHMTGHATYFGKMLWVILILEEWSERHATDATAEAPAVQPRLSGVMRLAD